MRNRIFGCVLISLCVLPMSWGLVAEAQVVGGKTVSVSDDLSLPPARLPFRGYESDRGLRCFYLHAIAQDSLGFLWVGGEDGLYRYDGGRFTRFGLNEGLPSSIVTSLATGPKGEVWAGTFAGLAVLKGEYFQTMGPESGLVAEQINGISIDDGGRLYVAQPSGLFFTLDGKHFETPKGWPGGLASAVSVTGSGNEVFAASNSRVYRLGEDGKVDTWDVMGVASGEKIEGLKKDAQGLLWARSTNGSLFCKKPTSDRFEDLSSLLPQGVSAPSLALDWAGNLMVTTIRGVMRHMNGKWSSIGGIAQGFAGAWRAIYEDREGSLWVAGGDLSTPWTRSLDVVGHW